MNISWFVTGWIPVNVSPLPVNAFLGDLPLQPTGRLREVLPARPDTRPGLLAPIGPSATVLVVDPVGTFREVWHPRIIEHVGYHIVYTSTVLEVDQVISDGLTGDLALVSLHLNGNASRVIRTLRSAGWGRVIALTTSGMPVRPVVEAFDAGASGVLRVAGTGPKPDSLHPARHLSAREVQVIRLVAQGCSNKEIARRLSLSALTVKNHLARVGRKFGAGDRAHIVAIACRGGVIPGFSVAEVPLSPFLG